MFLETILKRRGIDVREVTMKKVYSLKGLPAITYLGLHNGEEIWLAYNKKVVYRVVEL